MMRFIYFVPFGGIFDAGVRVVLSLLAAWLCQSSSSPWRTVESRILKVEQPQAL